MQSSALTPQKYIASLPPDRKKAMSRLRTAIRKNLPGGFTETMNYGMIGYVVPHSLYKEGYHCDPSLPLPFMSIASQKHFIAIYHMGMYADKNLLDWFTKEYAQRISSKPDMGKSCLRFKKIDSIPYDLIGMLAKKMSVRQWISLYEERIKR